MRIAASPIPTIVLLSLCMATVRAGATDCNQNGTDDLDDLAAGTSRDCNANAVPDDCDMAAGSIAFAPSTQYTPGGYVSAVGLPDIDGDGDRDLLTTSYQNGNAGLYRNHGDGSFAEPLLIPTGGTPRSVTAADLDGDGRLDLAFANEDSALVSVVLQGEASFEAPLQLPAGERVREVVAADLEGDGDVDLVTGNQASDTVTILRNDGDGSFAPPLHLPAGPGPRVVVAADLDADGDLDLAGTTWRVWESPTSSLWLIRNDGGSGFAPAAALAVGTYPLRLGVADIDADGALDLVSVNMQSSDVSLLFNQGDGTFEPALNLPVGQSPEHMVLADLEGDGDLDIAAAGANPVPVESRMDEVAVLWNQGQRTFSPAVVQDVYGNPFSLAAGDLDGDGDLDLLIANQGDIAILAILPGGALAPAVHVAVGGLERPGPVHVECADLNGDGKPDVVTRNSNGESSSVLLNASASAVTLACPDFLRGDVNADGTVSMSDMLMQLRISMADPVLHRCKDAADLIDDDAIDVCDEVAYIDYLFENPDWTALIPAPFPAPGHDPTPLPVQYSGRHCPDGYDPPRPGGFRRLPIGCSDYSPVPAAETADLIRLGSVAGGPGQTVKVPLYLSASVPAGGVQLVIAYDPGLVSVASGPESLTFEGTFFEQFFGKMFTVVYNDGRSSSTFSYGNRPAVSSLTDHPSAGVFTIGLVGNFFFRGFEVPPGEDVLLAWIHVTVSESVADGTLISLTPTNGPDGLGVGPYRLRNEITTQGEAQYVQLSSLPQLEGALIGIVGDQSFFRADANGDDAVDLSDSVHTLGSLFLARGPLDCEDAADSNDDGRVDIADPVFTLNFLFSAGAPPPPPGKERGPDPTPDAITCYRHARG
jgi:hypothetical protein